MIVNKNGYEIIGTGHGLGIIDFNISGYVKYVNDPINEIGKCVGKIIIVDKPDPSIVILMREVKGVISRSGGLTCHVASIGRELGVPVVVGVNNVYDFLVDNMLVEIECKNTEGIIYAIKNV